MTDDELIEAMAAAMFRRAYMLDMSSAKTSLPYAAERFQTYARAALTALREAGYEVRAKSPT